MDLELGGKTTVVIGGSNGIGAETARVLAAEGCDVAITYRSSRNGAEAVAEDVRNAGRAATVHAVDLADPEAAGQAMAELAAELAPIDVVVLCAGQNIVTPYQKIGADEWSQVFAVNLTGAFFTLRSLAPAIANGGSVVTVASVAAHTGAPHHMHYAAAKAGLVNLTWSLARELAPEVRVNCVAPGITLTEMGSTAIASQSDDYAQTRLLLQRFATPQRVAQTIAFVASPVCEYMTGATIDVNSGRNVR